MADSNLLPTPDAVPLRVIAGGADPDEAQPSAAEVLRQLAVHTWRAAERMPTKRTARRLRLLAANLDGHAAEARRMGD